MKPFSLLPVLGLLAVTSVFGQGRITIEKVGSGKQGLTVDEIQTSGQMGQVFAATLANDLKRSGWFELQKGTFAGIKVTGTAAGDADAVRTSLQVTWPQGRFAWGEASQGQREVRRQAHRLSDEIVKRILNKRGMAATRIVFVGKQEGGDLYYCDADGYGMVRLTQDRVTTLSPYWDPAGQNIHYTSYLKGYPNVYRVAASGGSRQPLSQFSGLNTGGAVAPDGGLMALVLSLPGNPELYVLNLSSRNLTRLTRTPHAAEASPTWSPDGQSIAYVSDAARKPHLYVINQNDKQPRRMTYQGSENVAPDWGPDGRIAYCTRQSGYQIAILDPSNGRSEVITSGPDHEDPSWAPDGRHIVCARAEGRGRSTLYVLDTLGDDPIRLLTLDGNWVSPDWSDR